MKVRRRISPRSKRPGLYPLLQIVLGLVLTIGTMLLFPLQGGFRYGEFQLNAISKKEIIAPFTFEILKSDEVLKRERESARNSIRPVFNRIDSVESNQKERIEALVAHVQDICIDAKNATQVEDWFKSDSLIKAGRIDIRVNYGVDLTAGSWDFIVLSCLSEEKARNNFLKEMNVESILGHVYGRGILDRQRSKVDTRDERIRIVYEGEERLNLITDLYQLSEARDEALALLKTTFSVKDSVYADSAIRAGFEIVVPFLAANILYDERETEIRRDQAEAKVPVVKGIVIKDERIIDSNEKITEEHLEKLRSMEIKRAELAQEESGFIQYLPWAGRFLLSALIYFMFGFYLYSFEFQLFHRASRILLVAFLVALPVSFFGLVILPQGINTYLFPAALGAVVLSISINSRIAIIYSFVISFIIGALTGNDFFAMLSTLLPALLASLSVQRVRTRLQIMRASLLVFAGLTTVLLLQRLLTYSFDYTVLWDLLYATSNAILTPLLALGLLIAIEPVFGVTTNLTLLELADLNRPLLKRLSLEAPGTYHHSIMVGNLAEAAAEAIDANPLLVRAGAYYHDIGKMVRKEYFVENQFGNNNVHDQLDPEDSAKYLSGHVLDGVKIAEEYRLPDAIQDFIREHHGTSLMFYFYDKALKTRPDGSVDEKTFRYPGPKPQTKETGILMLSDSAEAAIRTLDSPTSSQIRRAVREIVINKYRDRELDECPLTLHDINMIIDAWTPLMAGIHHHRIKYPSREKVDEAQENIENADLNDNEQE